ncbi:hypothetical protein Scep_016722 [Stephania cephalantha]|uniref:Uncharacterized protein n=1 Tax=Stephania cephalantha TaxID=152367 RepID=A0AAP0NUF5_9MAGN
MFWRCFSSGYVSLNAYISAQLGHMHEYMTRTFTAINTHLDHQGDHLRRIEGHLLPARPARDDCASGSACQTSFHLKERLGVVLIRDH